MSVRIMVLKAKIRLLSQKMKKEALKLSFAVLVVEVLMVVAFAIAVKYDLHSYLQPKVITIEIARAESPQALETSAPVDKSIEKLSDTIWSRESSRGVNNYSKCAAINKINSIGFGIPGNGKYMCFDSHEEEMQVLAGWLIDHRAQGMSDQKMLCHYSGNHYVECNA